MTDGMTTAFSSLFSGMKPYDAQEYSAKSATIDLYYGEPIVLNVKDHEGHYRNISYRQGSWAWSAIRGVAERAATMRQTCERYAAEQPDTKEALMKYFDKWAQKHVSESIGHMARHSSMASAAVVGPSNFPASRERKRQDWADGHLARIEEHVSKGQKVLKRIAYPYGDPRRDGIRANNPEAEKLINEKIDHITRTNERMKSINAVWRKAKRPGKDSPEAHWDNFATNLVQLVEFATHEEAEEIRAGCLKNYMAARRPQAPYGTYTLQRNTQEIARLKKRLASIQSAKTLDGAEITRETTEGTVRVVQNAEAYRLQIIFDGKPEPETRQILKRNGFRWAPSQGAWQRHLNANGIDAAREVLAAIETKENEQ